MLSDLTYKTNFYILKQELEQANYKTTIIYVVFTVANNQTILSIWRLMVYLIIYQTRMR
jgi:hypothetical protein